MKLISFKEKLQKELENEAFAKEYERLSAWRDLQIKLIDARKKANLTQEELANRLNVNRSSLARLEKNLNANPTFDTITRYAKALGMKKLEIEL